MAVALFLAARSGIPRYLRFGVQRQLSSASTDVEIQAALFRAAGLGLPGIPVLVSSLGSKDPRIVELTRGVLLEAIDHWQIQPVEKMQPIVKALIRKMVEESELFGPISWDTSAEICETVLEWRELSLGPADDPFVDDCDYLLRQGMKYRTRSERTEPPQLVDSDTAGLKKAYQNPLANASQDPDLVPLHVDVPRGGLAITEEDIPLRTGIPQLASPVENARSKREDAKANIPTSLLPDGLLAGVILKANRSDASVSLFHRDVKPDKAGGAGSYGTPSTFSGQMNAPARLKGDDNELQELRRGLPGKLADSLIGRLESSEVSARLELTTGIIDIPGVDPRPWLLRLSHDQDARVREASLAIMATATDVRFSQRIREMSYGDPDGSIRSQAGKAVEFIESHR